MAYTTINKSSEYFNTITWTGDSTTPKNIEGVGFQPNLIWGKIRSQTYSHQIYDTVRGFGNDKELTPNNTNAEGGTNAEQYGYLSAVTSDGFTAVKGTDAAGYDYWNESPDTYVAWNWLAGGTGVSNTDGSTTSTVSANQTSGFSIVKWVGVDTTVGHGLNAVPEMIIVKNLDDASHWIVYHKSIGNGKFITLNEADGEQTNSGAWNATSPTSSVFTVGSALNNANYIAYVFAPKKGFSKMGSYVGNGSTDGTFVYTGFKPAFVLFKKTTGSLADWQLWDNKRDPYNPVEKALHPDIPNTASTDQDIDFLSNGFKLRSSVAHTNETGVNFIYLAFAEQPLVGTNNVPATAR